MAEWPLWRLVLENVTRLGELETSWNLDDVARANALLDMRADLEAQAISRLGGGA